MVATFVILIMMLGLLAFIVAISRLKSDRLEAERAASRETSMTSGELEELIRRAVVDATASLRTEMEDLSARIDAIDNFVASPDSRADEHVPETRTIGRTRSSST